MTDKRFKVKAEYNDKIAQYDVKFYDKRFNTPQRWISPNLEHAQNQAKKLVVHLLSKEKFSEYNYNRNYMNSKRRTI